MASCFCNRVIVQDYDPLVVLGQILQPVRKVHKRLVSLVFMKKTSRESGNKIAVSTLKPQAGNPPTEAAKNWNRNPEAQSLKMWLQYTHIVLGKQGDHRKYDVIEQGDMKVGK